MNDEWLHAVPKFIIITHHSSFHFPSLRLKKEAHEHLYKHAQSPDRPEQSQVGDGSATDFWHDKNQKSHNECLLLRSQWLQAEHDFTVGLIERSEVMRVMSRVKMGADATDR